MAYLFVAIGGALGACLRYFLINQTQLLMGKDFPYGTLLVNIVGSFCIGAIYAWLTSVSEFHDAVRPLIIVGLLGSLTTFSTFSFDTVLLLQSSQWVKAGINIILNVTCCLCVTWVALHIFKG
jgi:CrcB protein